MKNYFLLLALLAFRCVSVPAQNLVLISKPDSAIKLHFVRSGRYSSAVYTINDEPVTTATIKKLLAKYPNSALELHKYRAQKRLALGLLPVFIAGVLIGGIQSDKHLDAAGSPFSKAPVPFSIGLSAWFGSIILLATNTHYAKAIEAYNRQFK